MTNATLRTHLSVPLIDVASYDRPSEAERWATVPCRQTDPELWWSDDARDRLEAKRLCRTCPMLAERDVLGANEKHGVWAGRDRDAPKTRSMHCGTSAGYKTHRRRGERSCSQCLEAHNQAVKAVKAQRGGKRAAS